MVIAPVQAPIQVPISIGTWDIVLSVTGLVVGLTSLVLGGFAIWLSIRFKADADKVNQTTLQLLGDIRAEAKGITAYALPELRSYGEMARQIIIPPKGTASGTVPPKGSKHA